MASITATEIDKTMALDNGVLPMLETPSGGMVNAQGTEDGETLVSIKASELAALATQATLAAVQALATTPVTPTAITPSDATVTTAITAKGIKVGGAGNLVVKAVAGGADVTYAAAAGDYFPCQVSRVMAASTATSIVGLS
jgi:hypothetical protein